MHTGAERDVVVLVGLEPQLRWRTFCDQVTATAQLLGVSQVITLGALLADVPHTRPVEVYGSTDDDRLMQELELSPSSYEGESPSFRPRPWEAALRSGRRAYGLVAHGWRHPCTSARTSRSTSRSPGPR